MVFEAFVDGQEVECAVIGSDPAVATRPGEILAGAEFYTYDDKYKNGVSQTVIPATCRKQSWTRSRPTPPWPTRPELRGSGPLRFLCGKGHRPGADQRDQHLPGFTSISMYPKLMEHEGLPVPQLIDRLIALALERTEKQHG